MFSITLLVTFILAHFVGGFKSETPDILGLDFFYPPPETWYKMLSTYYSIYSIPIL